MRRERTAALIGAVMIPVAGCGGSEGDSAPSTAPPSAPSAPTATTLVLADTDLPAGYAPMTITRQQIIDAVDTGGGTARISPTRCVMPRLAVGTGSDDVAMVAGVRDRTSIAAGVMVNRDVTIEDVRKALTGRCATVTRTRTGTDAITSKTVRRELRSPQTTAADTVVVSAKTTLSQSGTTRTTRSISGYAVVNGFVVTVQAKALLQGRQPDRSAFDATFTEAVDKAVDGTR